MKNLAFRPVLLSDLKHYNKETLLADLFAGVTVGVVALPLAMAFAIACGLPPDVGITTAIIGGFLAAVFGGSRRQVSGPTGAFVVIIVSIIAQHGIPGLMIATLMAGVILILLGAFRLGALIKFVPFPVVTGFTSGIAVVIFSTQLKDIFGLPGALPVAFHEKLIYLVQHISEANPWPIALCVFTTAIIFLCRRYYPKLPAMLIGMLSGTAIAVIFKLNAETIGMRFGELPSSLPLPSLPAFEFGMLPDLLAPAVTIALLAAIESLLSATVADSMTGDRHNSDTELIGQGIGNIGAVIFGGIPVTGAIARTATNIRSGGRTPVAGIVHALTLAMILLLFGSQATMIPLAILSGVMVVVCYNMSEYHAFLRMFRGPKSDWGVMVITFLVTVFSDLIVAVMIGMLLSVLLFIRRMAEAADVKVVGGDDTQPDPDATSEKDIPPGVLVFEVQGAFFFGAVNRFQSLVWSTVKSSPPRVVVLRLRHVPIIDATGLNVLLDFAQLCQKHHFPLVLSGVQPQPYRELGKYGVTAIVGKHNVCRHIDEALVRVKQIIEEQEVEKVTEI